MLTEDRILKIHTALHEWDGVKKLALVDVNTKQKYFLQITPKSRCRTVCIYNYRFIEQNKKGNTIDADNALKGAQITWIIPLNKSDKNSSKAIKWGKIVNGTIIVAPPEVI